MEPADRRPRLVLTHHQVRNAKTMVTIAATMLAAQPLAALSSSGRNTDSVAVRMVLPQYKSAIERLDANGTEALFTGGSQVFENGGIEGSYVNYLAKLLGPEPGHFRSFKFSDYRVEVRFEGPIALTTETYNYRIETEKGEIVEWRGVATSVLKEVGRQWRTLSMHGSSRKPKAS